MIMSGNLAFINAQALFQYIENNRKTVTFVVRSREGRRSFYFLNGKIVWASSEYASEQLCAFLIERGICSQTVLDRNLAASQQRGAHFTRWLLENGEMSSEELESSVQQLTRRIILNTFRDSHGEFEMTAGVPHQVINGRIQLSPRALVLEYFQSDDGESPSPAPSPEVPLLNQLRKILLEGPLDKRIEVSVLPDSAIQVVKKLRDPMVSGDDISKLIMASPQMSTRILRAANSPLFALGRNIESLPQAVALLGFRHIAQMVLALSLQSMRANVRFQDLRRRLHAESVKTAFCARDIAFYTGKDVEDFFLLGLLYRIGSLIALDVLDRTCPPSEMPSIENNPRLEDSLKRLEGEVATKWGEFLKLPAGVMETIRQAQNAPEDAPEISFAVLRLASRLAGETTDLSGADTLRSFLVPLLQPVGIVLGEKETDRLCGSLASSLQMAEALRSI